MPHGTKADRLYEKLRDQGYSQASAAKIAQKATGLSLATGKPPKHYCHDCEKYDCIHVQGKPAAVEKYEMKKGEVSEGDVASIKADICMLKDEADPMGIVDNLAVWKVNGDQVKVEHDMNFRESGNGFYYDFIPKTEIWIDEVLNEEDWKFHVLHEAVKAKLIKSGVDRDKACELANVVERKWRVECMPAVEKYSLDPMPRKLKRYEVLHNQYQKHRAAGKTHKEAIVMLGIFPAVVKYAKDEEEKGQWITLESGTHVHIKEGEIDKGPKDLKDKNIDDLKNDKAPEQKALFHGLNDAPGQQDLFDLDNGKQNEEPAKENPKSVKEKQEDKSNKLEEEYQSKRSRGAKKAAETKKINKEAEALDRENAAGLVKDFEEETHGRPGLMDVIKEAHATQKKMNDEYNEELKRLKKEFDPQGRFRRRNNKGIDSEELVDDQKASDIAAKMQDSRVSNLDGFQNLNIDPENPVGSIAEILSSAEEKQTESMTELARKMIDLYKDQDMNNYDNTYEESSGFPTRSEVLWDQFEEEQFDNHEKDLAEHADMLKAEVEELLAAEALGGNNVEGEADLSGLNEDAPDKRFKGHSGRDRNAWIEAAHAKAEAHERKRSADVEAARLASKSRAEAQADISESKANEAQARSDAKAREHKAAEDKNIQSEEARANTGERKAKATEQKNVNTEKARQETTRAKGDVTKDVTTAKADAAKSILEAKTASQKEILATKARHQADLIKLRNQLRNSGKNPELAKVLGEYLKSTFATVGKVFKPGTKPKKATFKSPRP